MKHKISKTFILLLAVSTLLTMSCKKQIDDAYQNPNAPTRVPIETILPGLIGNFLGSSSNAGSSYGLGGDGLLIGRYIQYWGTNATSTTVNAGTQYDQMGGTQTTSDNLGSLWGAFYYGMGQNLNRVIDWGTEEQKWDYVGVAFAIRSWGWLELANEYDNAIIVRQSFNTSLQSFNYDSTYLAYDSCRAAAYKALAFLSRTDGAVSASNLALGDAYFYNGDVSKWKKFVYGVLARSYNYLSNKSAYLTSYADSAIYYAGLAMTTNADNATCKFASSGLSGTNSYMGIIRSNVGTIRQSAYIANLMTGANTTAFTGVTDPRVWYMLRENTNGTIKGITPWNGSSGLTTADQPQNFWGGTYATTSTPPNENNCRYLFRNTAPFPIMTASEMQFIKAEAAYRKGDKVTALAAYTNAISLNIDMLISDYSINVPVAKQITPAMKASFMSNTAIVPTNPANLTLTHIMLQKYIALFGWGMQETWTDMRRFHYTDTDPATTKQVYADFTPPSGSNLYTGNNGKLVYRCRPRYNSEYIYNVPSLQKVGAIDAAGSQITDYCTKEGWFSQN
ncbi:MAG: SusD/RagB family nutrient-binding outer membrane lipoprotein [Ferruginibacter sp.]